MRQATIQRVKLSDIVMGPERHLSLTPEQEGRIRAFHETFLEVYPCTLEKAFSNFRKDMHPDREIVIWERMAEVYKAGLAGCKTLKARKALFARLLGR